MKNKTLTDFSPEIITKSNEQIHQDNGEEVILKKIYGEIPLDIEDSAYLSIFRESKRDIHNIALYPCKYIPELPKWAIQKYSKEGDTILDPFIGGGTTFIEAKKLNRNCFGTDYNPYARLVSKVKSTPLKEKDLLAQFHLLKEQIIVDDGNNLTKPDFRGVDFWFNEQVIIALSKIKKHVNLISDETLRDFFLVAFSMAVRKSSYIAPGQMLTARRKDWRTIKQLSEKDTFELFCSFCKDYISYMSDFYKEANNDNFCKLIGDDARKISLPDNCQQVDLIVASPPYINAMDYIWANRLRVHWLDLVKNDEDRLNLYNFEIGTERISKKEYSKIEEIGIKEIDETIKLIFESHKSNQQSQLRSKVTYKYFLDMKKHFENAYRVLKNGGRYCIVIGDNNIRKVYVPTSEYLTKIAELVGFKKEMQFQIILKNRSMNVDRNLDFANKIDYDRMIVLKKE